MNDLTELQYAALMAVQNRGPVRTSRVADVIGIRTRSALSALKALEKKGRVRRHPQYTYPNDICWEEAA